MPQEPQPQSSELVREALRKRGLVRVDVTAPQKTVNPSGLYESMRKRGLVPEPQAVEPVPPAPEPQRPHRIIGPSYTLEGPPPFGASGPFAGQGRLALNIPASAANLVAQVFSAAKDLPQLGAGLMASLHNTLRPEDKVALQEISPADLLSGIQQVYAQRFGTPTEWSQGDFEKLKRTMVEDPVGFVADLSVVLGGAGAGAKGVGAISRSARMAEVGSGMLEVGRTIDPFAQAIKPGVLAANRKLRDLRRTAVAEFFGTTSGRGDFAIKKMLENPSPELRRGLRDKTAEIDLAEGTMEALERVKAQRGAVYRSQLEALPNVALDLGGLKSKFKEMLGRFDISVVPKPPFAPKAELVGKTSSEVTELYTKGAPTVSFGNTPGLTPEAMQRLQAKVSEHFKIPPEVEAYVAQLRAWEKQYGGRAPGSLDFRQSALRHDASAQRVITDIADDIKHWRDSSALGVDRLKQGWDRLYGETNDARAFSEAMADEARGLLKDNVPGYAEMVGDYQVASDFIRTLQKELSLNRNNSPGTIIEKLKATLSSRSKYRQFLVESLEEQAGMQLSDLMAGVQYADWQPPGMVGRGTVIAAGGALTGYSNPFFIAAALSSSPRVVGEALVALSRLGRGAKRIGTSAPVRLFTGPPQYPTSYRAVAPAYRQASEDKTAGPPGG